MLTNANIRNRYAKIQHQLFYMIPEKWDKVYLYAAVIEHFNHLETGEMFFYYYPKSMLKKNPINVYEVPNKFNIDEKAYLHLADKLYAEIKELRNEHIKMGEKPWSNITIKIEDFKFKVNYLYEDLANSRYTSYDRHLIWRYQNLNIPITSYHKKERVMIEQYISEQRGAKTDSYSEGIYRKPVNNIIEYNKQEEIEEAIKIHPDKESEEKNIIKSQILNLDK